MSIPGISHSSVGYLWDAIVTMVRADGPFSANVKLMQLWEGRETDLTKWDPNTLPALRMTPGSEGAKWSAEIQHDAPLVVHVELIVGSTYAPDLFDLWMEFVRIFFPGDNSVLNSLRQYGVYLISWTAPAWSTQALSDGTRVLYGAGMLKFDQYFNT